MIVDASAILAIAFDEPSSPAVWSAIDAPVTYRISAANLLEFWMVLDRRGTQREHDLVRQFMEHLNPTIEPVTAAQVEIARDAWRRYGRGSGHPARLNFGDCFAYALATFMGEPLLFVGNDFTATDIEPAISG